MSSGFMSRNVMASLAVGKRTSAGLLGGGILKFRNIDSGNQLLQILDVTL